MRSLSLVKTAHISVPNGKITCHARHPDHDSLVFVATEIPSPNGGVDLEIFSANVPNTSAPNKIAELLALPEPPFTLPKDHPSIISFKYLPESDQLCIILAGGDIALVQPDESRVEIVGSVDAGIKAAEWSPDDELLLLVTGEDKLIEMTREFDVLSESPIETGDYFGEDKPVNVGWGSKRTQFQGSVGKSAALETAPPPEQTIPPFYDNGLPKISWRADGAFFALNAKINDTRRIRFYSRVAALQSTSEPVIGMEHSLSWIPDGSIIASTQSGNDVIFFERNGLRRYDFALKESTSNVQSKILSLSFNSDSTFIAVHFPDKVQLWTRNNYHWYLKSELRSLSNSLINHVQWHSERPLDISFSTSDSVDFRQLTWETFTSCRKQPYDSGSVAVADGHEILFTPFRYQNVPPPMSSEKLETLDRIPPRYLTFSQNDDLLIALLPPSQLQIWKTPYDRNPDTPPFDRYKSSTCLGNISLPGINGDPKQIAVYGSLDDSSSTLTVGLLWSYLENRLLYDAVTIAQIGFDNNGSLKINTQHQYLKNIPDCLRIVTDGHDRFYLESVKGEIYDIQQGDQQEPLFVNKFPRPCKEIKIIRDFQVKENEEKNSDDYDVQKEEEKEEEEEPLCIGLTESGYLYCGLNTVAPNCTSFTVGSGFLIYTSFDHRSYYIPLISLRSLGIAGDASSKSTWEPIRASQQNDPTSSAVSKNLERRVERGARIVTVVPSSMNLVLQMPRGNLETVKPRALVLQVVRKQLDAYQFKDAFLSCRKNRINLNFLHDHNPEMFRNKLDEFIDQINDVDHLNLLLSNLRNENVTKTLYGNDESKSQIETSLFDNKVNDICDAVRQYLEQKDSSFYTNTILTSHVCKEPADHPAALRFLTRVREFGDAKLQDAVKYLVFLSDANKLFDVALGMYDFELVLLIAQRSQKDPREFLPFLRDLRQLNENERRFRIDDHLGRYSSALSHLAKLGQDFYEQSMDYIDKHKLYDDALKYYRGTEFMETVLNLRGQYHQEKGHFREAAISFELANNYEQAVTCYMHATHWQQAFSLALRAGVEDDDLVQMADDITEELKNKSRYLEASTVQLDYAHSTNGAINVLCEGSEYVDAIRLAYKDEKYRNKIEDTIYPSMIECSTSIIEEIDELEEQINKQNNRQVELKEKWKREEEEQLLRDEELDAEVAGDVEVDNASTAAGTAFTRYTGAPTATAMSRQTKSSNTTRTAKSKRKQAKNKAIGKKGTIYEESYLIESLSRTLGERLVALQERVRILLRTMVTQHLKQETNSPTGIYAQLHDAACELQERLNNYELAAQKVVDQVWTRVELDDKIRQEGGFVYPPLPEEMENQPRPKRPVIKIGGGKEPILTALMN